VRRITTGQAVQPPEVHDLVTGRHSWVEPAFLWHVAPVAVVLLAHRTAVIPHLAAVGAQHPEHDSKQRCLAGTVRSKQPGDHPRRDVKTHFVEGQPVAEGVCDVSNLQPDGPTLLMADTHP
jgi:hypothetical protein